MTFTTRLLGGLTTTLLTASLMAAPATAGPPPGVVPSGGEHHDRPGHEDRRRGHHRHHQGHHPPGRHRHPGTGPMQRREGHGQDPQAGPGRVPGHADPPEGEQQQRPVRALPALRVAQRGRRRRGADQGRAWPMPATTPATATPATPSRPATAPGTPATPTSAAPAPATEQGRRTPTPGAGRTARTGPAPTTRVGATPRSTAPPSSPSELGLRGPDQARTARGGGTSHPRTVPPHGLTARAPWRRRSPAGDGGTLGGTS